ncbi:lysine--tRNA ligase [Candidatus Micrarchaeota archaeon]|nr:lysine--tRNA ligase [Candidatus Micrarchaeota archaeon]MBD3417420.1 lysine--tRNA ligase [Candidatus Micrarchaeota archaeon]
MESPSELKNMHWSEIIAKQVVEKKTPPYAVMSGITTSGPLHPGTLCEFMFADAVYKSLRTLENHSKFYFVADILDGFDNIPEPFKNYEKELMPYLGKPLAHTPDPMGCHQSFADHFLSEATDAMEKFGVHPEILRADKVYEEGKYDKYALEFSERKDEIKKIVQESSLRESMPDDWHPIMPICEKCGKVETTGVTGYENGEYEYSCDKKTRYGAEGCSYKGKAKISDHKYKLLWRLDWPARQDMRNVSAEGGSVDHHTRGGSISTLIAVHRKFFGQEPPILYKFGFLKYKGKKYSKSKGIGHSVHELMELLPIPVFEYALLRPDIQEDKELVLEEKTLLPLISDFEHAASLDPGSELARADRKKAISYSLTGGMKWKAPLADILVNYAIHKDWARVGELLKDPEGVNYLSPYILRWLERCWVPDKYVFDLGRGETPSHPEAVRKFAGSLNDGMSADEIQALVFETANALGIPPKELFQDLYKVLIGKSRGPRFGTFAIIIGIPKLKELLLA